MKIKDSVVIVTGASEGIGKSLAVKLAAAGAKVVVSARSVDKINALAQELPGSLAVHANMQNFQDIDHLVEKTIATYGRIDVLVNNAGQGMYGSVESVDIEAYKKVMNLNVFAPLHAMELVIPQMRKQGGGAIINISSMVSKNAFPGLGAYASTKYALNALTLTARAELEKDKIVVGLMLPRMTATRFGENAVGDRPQWASRPGAAAPPVDTPDQVADKVIKLIESGEAEAEM